LAAALAAGGADAAGSEAAQALKLRATVALAATAAARHAHLRGLDDEVGETESECEDGADMLTLQNLVVRPLASVRSRFGRRPVFRACLDDGRPG
jgi:hypothetical protein